jgi:hypothetical protein
MEKISKWFPPLCGLLAVVLGVAVGILMGGGQDATDKTAQEIVNHYSDHSTKEAIVSILVGVVAILVLYFAGWLRRFLRDAEGPDGILSAVVFGAAVVFSAGLTVAGSIHLALADLADESVMSPVAIQAINGIDFDMFLFFPVGLGTMVLATGISAVRHGALPKWFAWTGVVLGVLGFTPVFFIVFFLVPLAPLWIAILSIIGIRRAISEAPATAAA